jgi:hypothetical protein
MCSKPCKHFTCIGSCAIVELMEAINLQSSWIPAFSIHQCGIRRYSKDYCSRPRSLIIIAALVRLEHVQPCCLESASYSIYWRAKSGRCMLPITTGQLPDASWIPTLVRHTPKRRFLEPSVCSFERACLMRAISEVMSIVLIKEAPIAITFVLYRILGRIFGGGL